MPNYSVSEVFGIRPNDNPKSYIERDDVEKRLKRKLRERARTVIALHGSSLQGKSSLLRTLPRDSYLRATGAKGTTAEATYRGILNQCNAQLRIGREAGAEGEIGFDAHYVQIKLAGKGKRTSEYIQADLSNPDSVALALAQCTDKRTIVFDNFHFFDQDVQEHFTKGIRSFEDIHNPARAGQPDGFNFVVLGTWHSQSYLETLPGDLAGRVENIPVEPWHRHDLAKVLDEGQRHLNVTFHPDVKTALMWYCEGNVGVMQELTKETLIRESVQETQRRSKEIKDWEAVNQVAEKIAKRQRPSVVGKLKKLSECGTTFLKGETRSYWILKAFLSGNRQILLEGCPIPGLLQSTNKLVAKADRSKRIPEAALRLLIDKQWLEYQQKYLGTPIIAYDEDKELLMVLDGWTKLVLKLDNTVVNAL